MAAKEETGGAKHMPMSPQQRIPPDLMPTCPKYPLLCSRVTTHGTGSRWTEVRTLLVRRQQGQLTGAALVGFSEGNSQLGGHLLWPRCRDRQRLFAIGMLVGLSPTTVALASGAGNGGDLPKGAFHIRNDLGGKAFLGPAPPGRPVRIATCSLYMQLTSRVRRHRGQCAGICRFQTWAYHTLAHAVMRPTFAALILPYGTCVCWHRRI